MLSGLYYHAGKLVDSNINLNIVCGNRESSPEPMAKPKDELATNGELAGLLRKTGQKYI